MRQISFQRVSTAESVLPAVLDAVGEYEGVDPATVAPDLYGVVDPDALQSLFAPTADGTSRPGGQVTFSYHETTIAIDFHVHDGETWVRVIQQPESGSAEISASPSSEEHS